MSDSMRVLTVDDSVTIQEMVVATLQSAGHDVLRASDGIAGLTVLKSHDVDLIISDVNMINMGGFEFVSKVRSMKEHEFTPILFLTTENSEEFRNIGREVGATGWLTKPFDPQELLQTIKRIAA
jgi:two-component system, chemotaxis family, chemotaxis protein CheY